MLPIRFLGEECRDLRPQAGGDAMRRNFSRTPLITPASKRYSPAQTAQISRCSLHQAHLIGGQLPVQIVIESVERLLAGQTVRRKAYQSSSSGIAASALTIPRSFAMRPQRLLQHPTAPVQSRPHGTHRHAPPRRRSPGRKSLPRKYSVATTRYSSDKAPIAASTCSPVSFSSRSLAGSSLRR